MVMLGAAGGTPAALPAPEAEKESFDQEIASSPDDDVPF
jgi:hypothetical protein